MGLLSHIEEGAYNKVPSFSIFDFVRESSISQFCILKKYGTEYNICFSYNFDFDSIVRSISTQDFWNGIIPEQDKWYIFSKDDKSIANLYQFFSNDTKDSIIEIFAYNCSEKDYIYLILNTENDYKNASSEKKFILKPNNSEHEHKILENLKKCAVYDFIHQETNACPAGFKKFIYHFDYKNAIKNAADASCSGGNLIDIEKAVFLEIYFKTKVLFPKPHAININLETFTITIELFAKEQIPVILLKNQLEKACSKLIKADFSHFVIAKAD